MIELENHIRNYHVCNYRYPEYLLCNMSNKMRLLNEVMFTKSVWISEMPEHISIGPINLIIIVSELVKDMRVC